MLSYLDRIVMLIHYFLRPHFEFIYVFTLLQFSTPSKNLFGKARMHGNNNRSKIDVTTPAFSVTTRVSKYLTSIL